MTWNAILSIVALLFLPLSLSGQTKWYRFSKAFIAQHYSSGSAIGTLQASEAHAAHTLHSVSCGGNDGELHIGIPGDAVVWSNAAGQPISGVAGQTSSDFGVVAEPPNASTALKNGLVAADGQAAQFVGYFRVWNEGHDVGAIHPSNPHHVVELHPVWGIQMGSVNNTPDGSIVFSMRNYHGYGASKFRPLLESAATWLKVYEDAQFVYVQLPKAQNFYQIRVKVKQVKPYAGGQAVVADVFSSATGPRVFQNLTLVAAAGSDAGNRFVVGRSTFLLGFFSVNLSRAAEVAQGHSGAASAISAPGALEFFAFGLPTSRATTTCS